MAELADAFDLKSNGLGRVGSSPTLSTIGEMKMSTWESEPIVNLIAGNRQQYDEYFALMLRINKLRQLHFKSSKDMFKQVFGQQNFCMMGWNRNWVWEFGDKLRCYISKRGLSIEGNRKYSVDELLREIETLCKQVASYSYIGQEKP